MHTWAWKIHQAPGESGVNQIYSGKRGVVTLVYKDNMHIHSNVNIKRFINLAANLTTCRYIVRPIFDIFRGIGVNIED